jgi:hypothetical protein
MIRTSPSTQSIVRTNQSYANLRLSRQSSGSAMGAGRCGSEHASDVASIRRQ